MNFNFRQRWAIFALLFWASSAFSQPHLFDSTERRMEFLGYLRKNYPILYSDFVVRYEPFQFLARAQAAIDQMRYNRPQIQGFNLTVLSPDSQDFDPGVVDTETFISELTQFIDGYASALDVQAALAYEIEQGLPLQALQGVIARSPSIPDGRQILRMPVNSRMAALEQALRTLPQVEGFEPRRIGINRDTVSGAEFIELYRRALRGSYNSIRLIWLAALAHSAGMEASSPSALRTLVTNIDPSFFIAVFARQNFSQITETLIGEMSAGRADRARFVAGARPAFSESYEYLKRRAMPQATAQGTPLLRLTRGHPFELWLRGGVGDCSTFNAFATSLVPKEEMYYIRRPDGEVKGYLQYTRVIVNGEQALYVNTISGVGISGADTRRAFSALAQSLPQLGATQIVIPTETRAKALINFPEILSVFLDLGKSGTEVALNYTDGAQRRALAPFTEGGLDLPETNSTGIQIQRNSIRAGDIRVSSEAVTLDTQALFPEVSRLDAILIALELRNRNVDVAEVLRIYEVDGGAFESLWHAVINNLNNRLGLSVAEFHARIQERIQEHNLPIDWEVLKHSSLLFRGHFAASDALTGENFDLALEYIKIYLLSYSDQPQVYQILAPYFSQLVTKPKFLDLVRVLFRKNLMEMGRTLDAYEIEHRSAYQTLILLFSAGLPRGPFQAEINQLMEPLEQQERFSSRSDEVFLRRTALLGQINNFQSYYFEQMMNRLEQLARTSVATDTENSEDPEDLQAAFIFLDTFIVRGGATQAQINRIYRFATAGEFGLKLAMNLSHTAAARMDTEGLINALFRHGKYLWAGYLIYRDPWSSHPRAAEWVGTIWAHRDQIPDALFLKALADTPSWSNLPMIHQVINELMVNARVDISTETHMTKILVRSPEQLTAARVQWLGQVSTMELAQFILESIDLRWPNELTQTLLTQLKTRFPRLAVARVKTSLCQGRVTGTVRRSQPRAPVAPVDRWRMAR